MKTTIITLLLMMSCLCTQAQVKAIKPHEIHPMPKIGYQEYERLFQLSQKDNPTPAEKKLLEGFEEDPIYTDLYSGYCSWYCGGEILSVKASSCLKPYKKFTYKGKNAHDFNHESVWAEGAPGQGTGEYLVYEFPGKCPRITNVKILNGHVKSNKAWKENSRVKKLKMYYMDKPYAILELEDSRSLQCFDVGVLGPHNPEAPNWTMKFEIMEVYPGSKYEDTVISELYFDGIDVH